MTTINKLNSGQNNSYLLQFANSIGNGVYGLCKKVYECFFKYAIENKSPERKFIEIINEETKKNCLGYEPKSDKAQEYVQKFRQDKNAASNLKKETIEEFKALPQENKETVIKELIREVRITSFIKATENKDKYLIPKMPEKHSLTKIANSEELLEQLQNKVSGIFFVMLIDKMHPQKK